MKYCALVLLLLATPASAQSKTVKLHDKATNEPIGTITITGNTAYLRNAAGEHLSTITVNQDGSRTVYDPSGNVIKTIKE
jgi:hypothetical protein